MFPFHLGVYMIARQQPSAVVPLRIPMPPFTRQAFHEWWNAESGYREVLQLAWPLFLAQGSTTILQFLDRMFLTWYSAKGLAAAGPSGMLSFTIQALFIGLAGYTAIFVAQYTGAGRPKQAVAVVWQALYLSLLASLLILLLVPVGGYVFRLAGHEPAVQQMERSFFSIFLYGSFVIIGSTALSAYFIGKGMSRIVLHVNLVVVVINAILDYVLIFGRLGFPELGIAGAALASVIAQAVGMVCYFIVFLRESAESHTVGAWKVDTSLLLRLLHYGSANGLQFALDMIGWTFFLLLVGRLGANALAASNLAFQVNTIAFFPIIGFAMAASTLVGQHLGKDRPDLANRAVWSAIHIGLLFTLAIALLFFSIPGWLLAPFGWHANHVEFEPVRTLAVVMLRFVAAYCIFDVGNLIFSAALKGAGDTLFVMLLSTGFSTLLMILPTWYFCIREGGWGIYGAWSFLTITVLLLSFAFLFRYLRGHWQQMRVIEPEVI